MSKTAKYLAVGAILVVVFAVVYFSVGRGGGPKDKVTNTTITLVRTGSDGVCGIPGGVGKIIARHRDGVVFHVINNCPDGYTVRVGNFRPDGTGSPNDNVLTGARRVTVAAGAQGRIEGSVDRQGQTSRVLYKYDIFIRKGNDPEQMAKDPEYDIWP